MKFFHARVAVTLRDGMLDPQGEAVARVLQEMEQEMEQGIKRGMDCTQTRSVRVGKLIDIELASSDEASARTAIASMSAKLLAHPTTEQSEILTVEEKT